VREESESDMIRNGLEPGEEGRRGCVVGNDGLLAALW